MDGESLMKVAVIGSRGLRVETLSAYLPPGTEQIISGGAKGIDTCAKEYALSHGLSYLEFLPDYRRYGRCAPLKRNQQIIECADLVIAFWDGASPGTGHTIEMCRKLGVPVQVELLTPPSAC